MSLTYLVCSAVLEVLELQVRLSGPISILKHPQTIMKTFRKYLLKSLLRWSLYGYFVTCFSTNSLKQVIWGYELLRSISNVTIDLNFPYYHS